MEKIKEISMFPHGEVHLPPSKSIAHRAIICAGLSQGRSVIHHISPSQDMFATIGCMRALGMQCEWRENSLLIDGTRLSAASPRLILDAGESGSTLRFMIPIAAMLPNEISFTGQGRLMQRPQTEYISVLGANGVQIALQNEILSVQGPLKPGLFTLAGNISSQFVTGLLMALPLLSGDSEIVLSTPLQSASYVDLTLDVMRRFGVTVENDGYRRFHIRGNQAYLPQDFTVESDYSQAAFFLAAGALGCECECLGLSENSLQGDRKIIDLLKQAGAKITKTSRGGLIVKADRLLSPITVDASDIPDLVPPLAAMLCFCEGTSHIANAARLRFKESDRLAALTASLGALGAEISQGDDSLTITGVKALRGGIAESFGDHRIAMAVAVASIKSDGPVSVVQSDCVTKSYPDFWRDFEKRGKDCG